MRFRKNDEAVSPVIGVILMVAITVILAAVIAAFVFGMGPPKQAPQASIRVTSVNTTVAADTSVKLEHQGGADITLSDVKLIVEQGNSRMTWDQVSTSTDKLRAGDILRVYVGSANASVRITNSTGGSLTTGSVTSSPYQIQTASEVTVTMIDIPSGQQIAQGKIRT